MSQPTSVCVSLDYDQHKRLVLGLKFNGSDWEINVWIPEPEILLIQNVREAKWIDRGSLKIGTSAGAPVFWSCEDGRLSILVGHDDECWDFGVLIPEEMIDELITEIEQARSELP